MIRIFFEGLCSKSLLVKTLRPNSPDGGPVLVLVERVQSSLLVVSQLDVFELLTSAEDIQLDKVKMWRDMTYSKTLNLRRTLFKAAP